MAKCKGCPYCSGDIMRKEKEKEVTIVFSCNARPIVDRTIGQVKVSQITSRLPENLYPDAVCQLPSPKE